MHGGARYTPWVCRAAVGLGSGGDVPQGSAAVAAARLLRVSRRAHGQVCGGFLRGSPLKRSGNAPDRYSAFFCQAFFSPGKKSGKAGAGEGFDDDDTVAAFI